MKKIFAKRPATTDRTAYRMKPGAPAPKSSQSGYGHKVSTGGSTVAVGSRQPKVSEREGGKAIPRSRR